MASTDADDRVFHLGKSSSLEELAGILTPPGTH
jgi:hypothetical protein